MKPTQQLQTPRFGFSSFEQKDEAITELTGNRPERKLAGFQLIAGISNPSRTRNPLHPRQRKALHGVSSRYASRPLGRRGPPVSQPRPGQRKARHPHGKALGHGPGEAPGAAAAMRPAQPRG